ncbi:formate dehydrogenase [Rhodococcus sp. IITR03]|nr:formate dehydrogenase [Rhodococcus sp. IITR03]
MGRVTARTRMIRVDAASSRAKTDALAVEEPLELRVNGTPLAVTMRTPGADIELAQGFLLTEGVIATRGDIGSIRYCNSVDDDGRNTYNVLDIELAPGVELPDFGLQRNFYTTSSCGVCGKASLDAIRQRTRYSPDYDEAVVDAAVLFGAPHTLRDAQRVFDRTGGLHAAALFTTTGELIVLREDVGRHNAVDKVIGWAVENARIPSSGTVLLVSGRASFELTQKSVMAGIPILAAVSAPSSLAVDLASQSGVTLVGFLRNEKLNVYSRPERIKLTGQPAQ